MTSQRRFVHIVEPVQSPHLLDHLPPVTQLIVPEEMSSKIDKQEDQTKAQTEIETVGKDVFSVFFVSIDQIKGYCKKQDQEIIGKRKGHKQYLTDKNDKGRCDHRQRQTLSKSLFKNNTDGTVQYCKKQYRYYASEYFHPLILSEKLYHKFI